MTKIIGPRPSTDVHAENRIGITKENRRIREMRDDLKSSTDVQMAELGEHVRELREAKGLSVRGLAAQANVDATWLSRIERGIYSSPDPRSLWRLAQALGVEVEELYEDAGYTGGLPAFSPYLRAKYDLPQEAIDQLEAHFELINEKYQQDKKGDTP
jgi:transcriptional regulator with XRE-family HTH domain